MGRIRWAALCALVIGCGGEAGSPDAGESDAAIVDASVDSGASERDAGPIAENVIDSDYDADDDPDLLNPERGIYYWFANASDPHTIVAEWLYLGDFCDQELAWAGHGDAATSAVLNAYADVLVEHRDAGRKVLFRPRYDTEDEGGALNDCGVFQADTVERMRRHVDAIAAMLADFVDVVAFIEAGYLGRWGEWNHADHDPSTAPVLVDPDARRAFIDYVLDAYAREGVNRFVGLRRPLFARELADADPSVRVGLYNDCFMTTSSDYGTYSNFESDNPSNFASAEDARAWAMDWSSSAPFGGETCPTGDGTERWRSCDRMIGPESEPASLHMSYLHGGYAEDARQTWIDGGCYDEIKRRLGYRFEVRSVEYPASARPGQAMSIRIAIHNSGWSRLHNARRAYVILRSPEAVYSVGGSIDGAIELGAIEGAEVSAWMPGEDVAIVATLDAPPAGTYELALALPDPDRPDVAAYAIAIASTRDGAPLFDLATRENALGVSIEVAR